MTSSGCNQFQWDTVLASLSLDLVTSWQIRDFFFQPWRKPFMFSWMCIWRQICTANADLFCFMSNLGPLTIPVLSIHCVAVLPLRAETVAKALICKFRFIYDAIWWLYARFSIARFLSTLQAHFRATLGSEQVMCEIPTSLDKHEKLLAIQLWLMWIERRGNRE